MNSGANLYNKAKKIILGGGYNFYLKDQKYFFLIFGLLIMMKQLWMIFKNIDLTNL